MRSWGSSFGEAVRVIENLDEIIRFGKKTIILNM